MYYNKINISENKSINYKKTSSSISVSKSKKMPVSKKAQSSIPALEAQGRALLNLPKISFKGNTVADSSFEECLENTDLSEKVIKKLWELPPEQKKEALKLYEEGIIPEALLTKAVQKDSEIKEKMFEVIRKGISATTAIEYMSDVWDGIELRELDKNQLIQKYNKIIELINKGINPDSINNVLIGGGELSKEALSRSTYFLDKMNSSQKFGMENAMNGYVIGGISQADDEKYQRILQLLDMGIMNLYVINSLANTEEGYKKGVELFNAGYDDVDLQYLTMADDETCQKMQELMQKYLISAFSASKILELDLEEKEAALQKFAQNNMRPDAKFLQLPNELPDEVIQLFKDGYSEKEILSVMEYDYQNTALKQLINTNRQNNERWDDFIQNTRQGEHYKEQLNKQDIKFLKNHVFESDFYSPDEYTETFLYFKNLKTINDENILSCESFTKKAEENGLGDFAAKQDDMTYKNIEALLSVDPKSKKAACIRKILKLIQDGKINSSAFRKLSDLNDLKSIESMMIGFNFGTKTKSTGWDISNNLMDDIKLVDNEDFEVENYIDKYIPSYKSEKDGIENSKIGDTFILDGEKYIRIKTDENSSQTVKLTKETYARLFPPVERFLTTQQIMGNCYCIETLMSIYCNDSTRAMLLKSMEEDDDGNITIKMGNYTPVTFKDGKLPENELPEIYSSGADGYKLFEYAYSCALVEDKIKEAQNKLTGSKLAEFNDFIKSNPEDFFIYKEDGEIKWSSFKEKSEKGFFEKTGAKAYKTFNNFLLGNGGVQNDVYRKLGYKSEFYIGGLLTENLSKQEMLKQFKQQDIAVDNVSTLAKAKRLLTKPDYFKNHQVQIGLGVHAYSLTQEEDENGNMAYYLYNPHNQGFPIKFERLEDLLSKTSTVTIIETDYNKPPTYTLSFPL